MKESQQLCGGSLCALEDPFSLLLHALLSAFLISFIL